MAAKRLETLVALDFEAGIVASTPAVLHLLLLRTPEVEDLRKAYDSGEITSEDIRLFVDRLLRKNAASVAFPHQIALAAIAVVLESRFSPFAREFLRDLARVRSSRFWLASGVARICWRRHSEFAQTETKEFSVSPMLTLGVTFTDLSTLPRRPQQYSVTKDELTVEYANS